MPARRPVENIGAICTTHGFVGTPCCACSAGCLHLAPLAPSTKRGLAPLFLPLSFYSRSALTVARELLGTHLVLEEGGQRRVGRIVETEAYLGAEDLACHASKGRTPRTEVLYGPPGRAYVYLIYGMYHCFNVVVEPEGIGAAVLVRGVEPLEGFTPEARTEGPGRLCRAYGLTLAHNRLTLDAPRLHLLTGTPVEEAQVERGPRIGVDYAGIWAAKPFRLWVRDSAHVSRRPARKSPRRA